MNTYRLLKDTDSILYDDDFGIIFLPLIILLDIIVLPLQPIMYFAIKYIEKHKGE